MKVREPVFSARGSLYFSGSIITPGGRLAQALNAYLGIAGEKLGEEGWGYNRIRIFWLEGIGKWVTADLDQEIWFAQNRSANLAASPKCAPKLSQPTATHNVVEDKIYLQLM